MNSVRFNWNTTSCMLQTAKEVISTGVIAGLVCSSFVFPVSAQESGISSLLEEVVVTARKREEGLQDTPIAVSAFSGESLEARGIQRVDDIAGITPNMTFDNINTNGGGGSSAAVFLRGVGQRDFIPSADPGVGLYVDGVYFARSVGSVLDLIDIDRIEVLRGPQGTLFGRNTTGGAIAIHTVKPHETFDGKVRVRVGVDDRLDVLGKVNVPISDNLFMNATLASFNQDGFVVNPITGLDTGDDETMAFRGALRWLANDHFEVNISGDYARDRENGQARVISENPNRAFRYLAPREIGTESRSNAPYVHNIDYGGGKSRSSFPFPVTVDIPGAFRSFHNCDATDENRAGTDTDCANADNVLLGENTGTSPTFSDQDVYGAAATVNWQLTDDLLIKLISAWREVDSSFAHDGDNTPYFISFVRDEIYEQEQFSQEIQIQGQSFNDRLQWIIGGFYFTEDGFNFNPVDFSAIDIESGGAFDHESIAGFAQATFDVTEQLHITAGLRYTEDTKDFIVEDPIQTARPILAPPNVKLVLVEPGTTTLEVDDLTPMVNIAYDWNNEFMTYFTWSEGFKSGGIRQRNARPFGRKAPTYDPEFVESFEVGFKYNSPGGNFILNTAAFYADYIDVQLEILAPEGIAPQLENAGEAEIKGVELESRWSPVQSWFVEAAVGYLDAEITKFNPVTINAGGPDVGDRLPQVPKWTLAGSIIREFGLGEMGVLTARLDYAYRTKVFFSADNDPGSVMQSHGVMNASASWGSADDKYSLTFHADNIFDKRIIKYTEQAGSSGTQNDILARDFAWYLTGEYRF